MTTYAYRGRRSGELVKGRLKGESHDAVALRLADMGVIPVDIQPIEESVDPLTALRARLATSIALFYWRLRERDANDEYRNKLLTTEQGSITFLAALDTLGRERFIAAFDQL